MDYGTTSKVPLDNIKYLIKDFALLRGQAYRGSLDYIQPNEHKWNRDSSFCFVDMVYGLMLYAQPTKINREVS